MPGFQPLADLTDARLLSLLAESEFAFSMHGWDGDASDFFSPTPDAVEIRSERAACLRDNPARYCGARDTANEPLTEFLECLPGWTGAAPVNPGGNAFAQCQSLALALEPDFILLAPAETETYHGVAGAVCFPSGWDIRMALGRRIHQIHGRVPGLNEQLSGQIDGHLAKLPPGRSWTRLNWGISLSPARNQHPQQKTPSLADADAVSSVWLRLELQLLHKLPVTGAILFGIRPHSISFDLFDDHHEAAAALRTRLATIPPELLAYKDIGANAPLLDRWLQPS